MYPKTGESKLKVGVTSSSAASISWDCNVLTTGCAWFFDLGALHQLEDTTRLQPVVLQFHN
jgi:hypothetical protein